MYTALSYPHTKTMTLGIRTAVAYGQLQVGVEVPVKSDWEGWVLGEPPHLPPRVSTSWKGRLPGFWTPFPALSDVSCSVRCSDLSLPSPRSTVHPSESLLPGPPSVHVPMAQPWEEDLGAYMRLCEGLLSPRDSADVADLPRTSSHTKLGPAFPEGLQGSRSQVCLPLAPPCPSSAFFLWCCQENNTRSMMSAG